MPMTVIPQSGQDWIEFTALAAIVGGYSVGAVCFARTVPLLELDTVKVEGFVDGAFFAFILFLPFTAMGLLTTTYTSGRRESHPEMLIAGILSGVNGGIAGKVAALFAQPASMTLFTVLWSLMNIVVAWLALVAAFQIHDELRRARERK